MKNNNNIVILLIAVFIVVLIIGIWVFASKDKIVYKLDLPQVYNINHITLDKESSGVNLNNEESISSFMNKLNTVNRETNKESKQDIPENVEEIITVRIYTSETENKVIYLYQKGLCYYMEQPYNGIYKLSREEYDTITNDLANN